MDQNDGVKVEKKVAVKKVKKVAAKKVKAVKVERAEPSKAEVAAALKGARAFIGRAAVVLGDRPISRKEWIKPGDKVACVGSFSSHGVALVQCVNPAGKPVRLFSLVPQSLKLIGR
jgi:hypothetical protein